MSEKHTNISSKCSESLYTEVKVWGVKDGSKIGWQMLLIDGNEIQVQSEKLVRRNMW